MGNEVYTIKPFKDTGNRFLVIARVQDDSLHKEWIKPSKYRNFDLYLEYYGKGGCNFRNDCDFYSEGKETKWPRIYKIIEKYGEHIFKYDAVWIPDDDISTDCKTINKMFEIFMKYQLSLAQPALTRDSYYSHEITRQKDKYVLRYTSFVEVMAPIFSKKALQKCWKSFSKSQSGWGLDSIWPKLLGYPKDKMAIIDKTPVKHTRPVRGGTLYKDILGSARDELRRICKEYKVKEPFVYNTYRKVWDKKRK
ncbi:DUF707 domain-containing protein [Paenibacillus sedimenti]|uniref:DUF707 domain-containing protein n=1 Tax=Paenibacillus sedimenti TaxID=2770274 RepID=A0A926KWV3_9BACL|nr:DUF707 domain-containing protein [Paenibacillus sedimenti]MBD0384336.1 DUF707 domain-containing protein [Paenibacillus sedimenti]